MFLAKPGLAPYLFCCQSTLIMRISILLILLGLIIGSTVDCSAQNVIQSRKYRVIAYQAGNLQIESVSNIVEVFPAIALYVPSAFTPNGDGINDSFGAYGEALFDFTMQVWNRWGQLVFESDDASKHWDGSFKGELVPQGSYVYQISARGADGTPSSKSGEVLVLN